MTLFVKSMAVKVCIPLSQYVSYSAFYLHFVAGVSRPENASETLTWRTIHHKWLHFSPRISDSECPGQSQSIRLPYKFPGDAKALDAGTALLQSLLCSAHQHLANPRHVSLIKIF